MVIGNALTPKSFQFLFRIPDAPARSFKKYSGMLGRIAAIRMSFAAPAALAYWACQLILSAVSRTLRFVSSLIAPALLSAHDRPFLWKYQSKSAISCDVCFYLKPYPLRSFHSRVACFIFSLCARERNSLKNIFIKESITHFL